MGKTAEPRVPTDLAVRISTIEPDLDPISGRAYFRATWERCSNLSRGGAFIHTHQLLEPGRRVLVELSLPGAAPLETIGRVAWTRRQFSNGDTGPLRSGRGVPGRWRGGRGSARPAGGLPRQPDAGEPGGPGPARELRETGSFHEPFGR